MNVKDWEIFDYESLTVDDTATGVALDSDVYKSATGRPAKGAFMRNEGANIRFQVVPTKTVTASANGLPLLDTETYTIDTLKDLENFKAIRQGAVSSTLHVFYLR